MKLTGMVLPAAIERLGRWGQPRLRSSPTAQVNYVLANFYWYLWPISLYQSRYYTFLINIMQTATELQNSLFFVAFGYLDFPLTFLGSHHIFKYAFKSMYFSEVHFHNTI